MSLHGFRHTLSWTNDFTQRDEPPEGKEDLAAFTVAPADTFGELRARYNSDSELYEVISSSVKVKIKMDKSQSWVLRNSKTEKLKKHEQLHYNISALGGRDMERDLKKITAGTPEELMREKARVTSQIQSLITEINKEYDNTILWGTNHGRIDLHQEVWELHIKKLMNDNNGRLESVYAVMRR